MQDVSDLRVYQHSMKLLDDINLFLDKLPKKDYDLFHQLLRAARSIPALLAEGFAKKSSQRDFRNFVIMAMGSSDEVITHLRIAKASQSLIEEYKSVSKQLNSLAQKLSS
ncbi:MAG: 23S rRNA gene intervening protein [Candidatus Daviesbacteria bacterium GW2011_GWA2_42_7]|uniref:23S rRNA gene intervening protein n=2 Tax=Candidatus Daviesiibacteriota TaxID=1752718 RepID=A0A0G1BAR1_9BACT|nr:MAG: 23S rRNA gene intervening protein [Candidatus Daviesbacteria bacterium GW2011_GWA2_42_7]